MDRLLRGCWGSEIAVARSRRVHEALLYSHHQSRSRMLTMPPLTYCKTLADPHKPSLWPVRQASVLRLAGQKEGVWLTCHSSYVWFIRRTALLMSFMHVCRSFVARSAVLHVS